MKEQGGIIDEKGAEVEVDGDGDGDGDGDADKAKGRVPAESAAALQEEEDPKPEMPVLCRLRRDAERAAARRSMVASEEECVSEKDGVPLSRKVYNRGKKIVETRGSRVTSHFRFFRALATSSTPKF